jgi:predicted Zn-dependent protease with MMP-like domain
MESWNDEQEARRRMTVREFRLIARRAIKRLPKELRPYADECMVLVKRRPSRKLLRELEVSEDEGLYGLYEGPALGDRRHDELAEMPARIILFYEPLVEDCETPEELEREIHLTVLHEIGHHFGIDEDRLTELGYE